MECKEFLQLLDAFIDDELDAVQRKRMLEHADICESCARELNTARELSRMLAELDAEPVVPLAAQAAWRRAVKAESNKRRLGGFYRAVSGIAAAFVLMVGTTFAMRETGMLDRMMPAAETVQSAADYAYSGPAREFSISAASATAIEADGEVSPSPAAGARGMIEGDTAQKTAEAEKAAGELLARSAAREIHTEDFAEDHAQISDLAAEYGGYLMRDSVSGAEDAQTAQIEAAIPAEDLDGFLAALDYIGTVTKAEIFTEDITLNYFDAQSRLETLTAQKERLNAMIAATESANELSILGEQLEVVYKDIDEIESRIRGFESSLSFARVNISLYEGTVAAPAATEETGLAQRMKSGFASTISSVKDFFSDMAVSLAIIAPIAAVAIPLIAAVCIGIAVLAKRRRRRLEGRD